MGIYIKNEDMKIDIWWSELILTRRYAKPRQNILLIAQL